MSGTVYTARWQPVVLMLNRRMECKCGALATIVVGSLPDNPDDYCVLSDVDAWCQDCFVKASEEEAQRQ